MKLLTGTIALSVSFVLFIYLYGLKIEHSIKYNPALYIFPFILLFIGYACFLSMYLHYEKTKKK